MPRRATLRTYRHGLGDCHLVTLHGQDEACFRILIDCGVILGTPHAKETMSKVMADIGSTCDQRVDLLVVTHEHWDHVSGFVQAAEAFGQLQVGQVWLAWTENPNDPDAQALQASKAKALKLLRDAAFRVEASRLEHSPMFTSIIEFFGMAAGVTTHDALEAVRHKGNSSLRYVDPASAPFELPDFGARIYVLGPPRDPALLKRVDPSRRDADETYESALAGFEASVAPALAGTDDFSPFADIDGHPLEQAREQPFFRDCYFDGPDWRRIDADWMLGADELALALDNMTNNTSLVLAIELDDADVLLLAADAQVGNWLSWGACQWNVQGRVVTGNDLLRRTILYKVGHHGSVNATLKARGLSLMERLQTAVIPVDHAMAVKKGWGALPLEPLVHALEEATATRGCVLRTDQPLPAGAEAAGVLLDPLYVEVNV